MYVCMYVYIYTHKHNHTTSIEPISAPGMRMPWVSICMYIRVHIHTYSYHIHESCRHSMRLHVANSPQKLLAHKHCTCVLCMYVCMYAGMFVKISHHHSARTSKTCVCLCAYTYVYIYIYIYIYI